MTKSCCWSGRGMHRRSGETEPAYLLQSVSGVEITRSADPRSSYQQEIGNYGAEREHAEQLSTHQRSLCGDLDVRVLQPAAASCGKWDTSVI